MDTDFRVVFYLVYSTYCIWQMHKYRDAKDICGLVYQSTIFIAVTILLGLDMLKN